MGLTKNNLDKIESFLNKWGSWFIFLTRWLLTPLGIPVNFMAGIGKFPFKKFLFLVIAGELIWAFLYIYIGYLFGANWITILDYIYETPILLAVITVGIGSLLIGFRIWRKR